MSLYAVFVHSSGNFLSDLHTVWNKIWKLKQSQKIWHLLYVENFLFTLEIFNHCTSASVNVFGYFYAACFGNNSNKSTLENFLGLYGSVLHAHSLTCLHIHLWVVSQEWNEMVISQAFCYRSYELWKYVYLKFAAELILVWGGFICVIFSPWPGGVVISPASSWCYSQCFIDIWRVLNKNWPC